MKVVLKKKWDSFKLVSWFRLFLWWGAEVMKGVFSYRKPQAQVVHLSRSERIFPLSNWVVDKNKVYCIISLLDKKGVAIYQLPRLGNN